MEWTLDNFGEESDPHILKGGSWHSNISHCNAIIPEAAGPYERLDNAGFRLLYLPKKHYDQYRNSHQ